jgi:hypothetical protein
VVRYFVYTTAPIGVVIAWSIKMAVSKNQRPGSRGINLGKEWYVRGTDTKARRVMVMNGGKRRFEWAEITGPGATGRHLKQSEIEKR